MAEVVQRQTRINSKKRNVSKEGDASHCRAKSVKERLNSLAVALMQRQDNIQESLIFLLSI